MRCAWQAFINLLPQWMRQTVDQQGKDSLQELRLRLGQPPEMVTSKGLFNIPKAVSGDDLSYCVNAATRYSPWSASTAADGYLTAPGGHRIGLCGEYIPASAGIVKHSSLCLRIARDFPGVSKDLSRTDGSVLIIGSPGSGKTTLLRDLIRQRSEHELGSIAVVDERGEIFPVVQEQFCFPTGKRTDVLTGCPKVTGIEMALRNMGPHTIAVDEITAARDCEALIRAGWCGVRLIATAHAGSRYDLEHRPVYRPVIESGLFDTLIILHSDKSWRTERMDK